MCVCVCSTLNKHSQEDANGNVNEASPTAAETFGHFHRDFSDPEDGQLTDEQKKNQPVFFFN